MLDFQVKVCSAELLPTLLSGPTCFKHQKFTHAGTANNGTTHTLVDVLNGPAYAPVKGTGISWALEGQSKLLVIDSPVVEDGVDLVVYEAFL